MRWNSENNAIFKDLFVNLTLRFELARLELNVID